MTGHDDHGGRVPNISSPIANATVWIDFLSRRQLRIVLESTRGHIFSLWNRWIGVCNGE
jgi:hypothetical protein